MLPSSTQVGTPGCHSCLLACHFKCIRTGSREGKWLSFNHQAAVAHFSDRLSLCPLWQTWECCSSWGAHTEVICWGLGVLSMALLPDVVHRFFLSPQSTLLQTQACPVAGKWGRGVPRSWVSTSLRHRCHSAHRNCMHCCCGKWQEFVQSTVLSQKTSLSFVMLLNSECSYLLRIFVSLFIFEIIHFAAVSFFSPGVGLNALVDL